MLRIFLVDDNAMTRVAIKAALQRHPDWDVVGEACSGPEAVETFPRYRPELTVMDFLMPEMNGLEAARRLTTRNPDALILMITTDPTAQLQEEARSIGIRGVCDKNKTHSLEDAIDAVIRGGTYFGERR